MSEQELPSTRLLFGPAHGARLDGDAFELDIERAELRLRGEPVDVRPNQGASRGCRRRHEGGSDTHHDVTP